MTFDFELEITYKSHSWGLIQCYKKSFSISMNRNRTTISKRSRENQGLKKMMLLVEITTS